MRVKYMRLSRVLRWVFILMMVGSGDAFAASRSKIILMVKDRTETSEEETEGIRETSSGTEITTTTETETEVCTLHINIKNKEAQAYECTLEWYFISENIRDRDSEEEKIFDSGSKKVSLPAKGTIHERLTSKPFIFSTVSKDVGSSEDTETGDVYKGYVIFLLSDGKIISQKSSSSRYAKPEWIDRCQ